ncbi:short-chain dehydrogenase/reductase [Aeromicrobium sp. CTD01-1L150]|uniref:short-chain dehydrogenase/reductase n=1 Tax=Aeromicrobium sp. CTD01-1L150 TaxID=3341830 RepID=UPI0035BF15D3
MDLQYTADDTVLVTGASRGIGAALVRGLVAEGVEDIHVVGRDRESLRALGAEIHTTSDVHLHEHVLDLSDAAQRRELSGLVEQVDVLVNNAGAIPAGALEGADLPRWQASWDLKVWGYVELAKFALSQMSRRGHGVIVNMIGASGERHDASYLAGSMGNAALMAFTRTVGAQSLDEGIRVVGVNPGPVETERLARILRERAADRWGDPDRWRELTAHYPAGRIATVEEVADLAIFLASRRASYISGTIVTLDGGMSWTGSIL